MFPALPQHTIRQDWAVAAIPAFYALVYFVSMTFFAARYPAEVPYRFSLDGALSTRSRAGFGYCFRRLGLFCWRRWFWPVWIRSSRVSS